MRIREMIGEQESWALDSETEPEPIGHDEYVGQVLAISHQIEQDDRVSYRQWRGRERDDVSIKIWPDRIFASLARRAFDNYIAIASDDDRRRLVEALASRTMHRLDEQTPLDDTRVMLNHVPLFFHSRVALIGHRERSGSNITLKSDTLWTPLERDVLVGGLATMLYYSKNPNELRTVE